MYEDVTIDCTYTHLWPLVCYFVISGFVKNGFTCFNVMIPSPVWKYTIYRWRSGVDPKAIVRDYGQRFLIVDYRYGMGIHPII